MALRGRNHTRDSQLFRCVDDALSAFWEKSQGPADVRNLSGESPKPCSNGQKKDGRRSSHRSPHVVHGNTRCHAIQPDDQSLLSRLLAKRKLKKAALTAAMRKLITILNTGAICPVRRKRRDSEFCIEAVSGVEVLNSCANCSLNRIQCSPSGFMPVGTRFADYQTNRPTVFPAPNWLHASGCQV